MALNNDGKLLAKGTAAGDRVYGMDEVIDAWRSLQVDAAGNPLFTLGNPGNVKQSTIALQEQKTEAAAAAGTLTFSEDISIIEIYNTHATNTGVFTVNGIAISVPAKASFQAAIGGTPGKTVAVTGTTTYIVGRYK
jgi:hypothetical protein